MGIPGLELCQRAGDSMMGYRLASNNLKERIRTSLGCI